MVFARNKIVTDPNPMRANAGMSYFQMNFSPRYLIERKVLKAIAVMALVETSTRSAYGSARSYRAPPRNRRKKPKSHRP